MRDFNSNHINGNVFINDNSQQKNYKPLIDCDIQELLNEKSHRQNLLRQEKSQRQKGTFRVFGFCLLLLLISAIWYFINEKFDIVSIVISGMSMLIAFKTLEQADTPTEFEARQIHILNEINFLLREKR